MQRANCSIVLCWRCRGLRIPLYPHFITVTISNILLLRT